MKIIIALHGNTTGQVEDRYIGRYLDSLSQKGKSESKVLGETIQEFEVQRIFSSSKSEAKETANIIAKVTNAPIYFIKDLETRNAFGALTGLTKKEAIKKFPNLVEEFENDPVHHHIPNSEEYFKFAKRVIDSFNKIIEEELLNETESICIITHLDVLQVILREIIGFEIENARPCSIIELEYDGDGFEVISFEGIEGIEGTID